MARDWYKAFLEEVDKNILEAVSVAILKTSQERRDIEETVYNFTGEEISEHVKKGLSLGSNLVLHTTLNSNKAK